MACWTTRSEPWPSTPMIDERLHHGLTHLPRTHKWAGTPFSLFDGLLGITRTQRDGDRSATSARMYSPRHDAERV